MTRPILLLLSLFLYNTKAQDRIQPATFLQAIQGGEIDVIVDVRSRGEWSTGHVENATLIEDLASAEFPNIDVLLGCETCTLAVMCRSGARATDAITRLQTEYGFNGTIYNALGTHQWEMEGYPLVLTVESRIPPCSSTTVGTCQRAMTQNVVPGGAGGTPAFSLTAMPAPSPVDAPLDDDVNATSATNTTDLPSTAPTTKPGPSVLSVIEGEGAASVSKAQEADSSSSKHIVAGAILAFQVVFGFLCFV